MCRHLLTLFRIGIVIQKDWSALFCQVAAMLVMGLTSFFIAKKPKRFFSAHGGTTFGVDRHDPLFRLASANLRGACVFSYDRSEEWVTCRFTEAQARAFMLLHIFMHELGHHFDHIHQKHLGSSKGEDYAERFATSRFEQLLPIYIRVFGNPRRATPDMKAASFGYLMSDVGCSMFSQFSHA